MIGFILDTVLYPAVPAALATLAIPKGDGGPGRRASFFSGLAIAIGFIAGCWRHDGRPVIPPVTAQQWLPLLAVAGLAAGALIAPALGSRRSFDDACPFLGGVPIVIAASAASFVALFSYTARLSQIAAGLAAAVSACLIVHLVRRNTAMGLAARLAAAAPLLWLVYVTWRYNEMVAASFPLLLAAIVVAIAPPLRRETEAHPVKSIAIRSLLTGVLAGAATLLAYLQYEPYGMY